MDHILMLLSAASVALGGPVTASPAQKPTSAARDPNEKVCETIVYTGSRLAAKRVCGTRAEWEQRRRLDKEAIDRAQMSPNGPCNTINTHTGAPAC